ncbi:SDR family oxidoreductase [Bosea caraganae]|uniref:SDR family oxidoreductase n=1 Tax=Bosea caraganae TaxID=2763117 RepID=UPI001AED07C7|nr:SDR family oxidoreductase [Bosea caraganae]
MIVTGGTSGIDLAAVKAFAAEGGRVGFCGRREELGREIERAIRGAGGDVRFLRADIRDAGEVERFVNRVAELYGGLIPAMRRMATAEEIARTVLAIASDEHPFMTGSTVMIDGGMTAQL